MNSSNDKHKNSSESKRSGRDLSKRSSAGMLATAAIGAVLRALTHPDLAALYNPGMEVQVMVAQGEGQPVEDRKGTYHHEGEKWFPFRIPKNAATAPEFNDFPIRCELAKRYQAIGMTGWDFANKCSRWVAFDFDAITGHAPGVGISSQALAEVEQAARRIPWVTVRSSTSGSGLHLYVAFAHPPKTENHTEHAAVARAVLGLLSEAAGYDFAAKVDACGGVMWVCHRKMFDESGKKVGLEVLKQGEPLKDFSDDWRRHLRVIEGRSSKVAVPGIAAGDEAMFEQLALARPRHPLTAEHDKLIQWLSKSGAYCEWNQDFYCLVTHTASLKQASSELHFRGVFDTAASGREPGDHNCFCFPGEDGSWIVFRFSPGAAECDGWKRSENGWTYRFLNRELSIDEALGSAGGLRQDANAYSFLSLHDLLRSLQSAGIELTATEAILHRECVFKIDRPKRIAQIIVECSLADSELRELRTYGWLPSAKPRGCVLVIDLPASQPPNDDERLRDLDTWIRHLVTAGDGGDTADAGFQIKNRDGKWSSEPKGNIRAALVDTLGTAQAADRALGLAIKNPWLLVTRPFESEFPGQRQWNRGAAQFATPPLEVGQVPYHPHFDLIFEHCGRNLDAAVGADAWCRSNGIATGADYLRLWAAIVFQRPFNRLPYLFFYGPQNSGKSSFHLGLRLLLKEGRGYVEADKALTNQQGFNYGLFNAILCVVEETNLNSGKRVAYGRLKNWTTSPYLLIEGKGQNPFQVPNCSHWVQTANDPTYCAIEQDDTRIVVVRVDRLSGHELPWSDVLEPALIAEVPHFLRTLLNIDLPKANGRLWLPVLSTKEKRALLSNEPLTEGSDVTGSVIEEYRNTLVERVIAYLSAISSGKHGTDKVPQFRASLEALASLLGYEKADTRLLSKVLRENQERLLEAGIRLQLPEDGNRTAGRRYVTIGEDWTYDYGPDEVLDEELEEFPDDL